jgi:hypothetical protein
MCAHGRARRWIAHNHHYFTGDRDQAKRWYRKCIAYDTGRPDCQVFLSRFYLESGNVSARSFFKDSLVPG